MTMKLFPPLLCRESADTILARESRARARRWTFIWTIVLLILLALLCWQVRAAGGWGSIW